MLCLAGCTLPQSVPAKPVSGKTSGKPALPPAPPPPEIQDDRLVCTADVKQCDDGSFVSRNPDKGCAFAPCPITPQQ